MFTFSRHNKNKNFLVWVNEEDHIRVISMQTGGDMRGVFDRFCRGLNQVGKYITKQPYSLCVVFQFNLCKLSQINGTKCNQQLHINYGWI